MKTILITGANRGIGLGFTQKYLELDYKVIATCRNIIDAADLQQLKYKYADRLFLHALDVINHSQIDILSQEYKNHPIDILVNNAGVAKSYFYKLKLSATNLDDVIDAININAICSLAIIKAFEQNLKLSENPKIINLASMAGSISNANGFGYAYRISKCALNMITAMYAKENSECITVSLRPGWVKTELGSCNATLSVKESIEILYPLIEQLTLKDSGRFIDLDSSNTPW